MTTLQEALLGAVHKYSDNQPRDERGRFAGGGSGGATADRQSGHGAGPSQHTATTSSSGHLVDAKTGEKVGNSISVKHGTLFSGGRNQEAHYASDRNGNIYGTHASDPHAAMGQAAGHFGYSYSATAGKTVAATTLAKDIIDMDKLQLFIPLTKVDVEKRLVYGTVTEEIVDKTSEIMDYATSKPNFETWSSEFEKATDGKSVGNLRSMHGNTAAGKFVSIDFNDKDKRIDGCAKVVDDTEWNKVLEGVYTGFSVGGKYAKRWRDKDDVSKTRYTAEPSEVSLVDNPCVPTAQFEVIKADGTTEMRKFKAPTETEEERVLREKAIELCKAATKDPMAKVAEFEGKDVLQWHGFVEDARVALKKTDTKPTNQVDEFEQGWKAPDGTFHKSKDDARRYWLKKQADDAATASATTAAASATSVLDQIDAALDKRKTTADEDALLVKLRAINDGAGAISWETLSKDLGSSIPDTISALMHDDVREWMLKNAPKVSAVIEPLAVSLGKRQFSASDRKEAADKGEAMPDGSFPIKNTSDLDNAIRAYGRAKDKVATKAHIVARAKALDATSQLPKGWEGSTGGADKSVPAWLKKGLSSVSRLANIIQDLHWLRQEVEYEEAFEQDDSTLCADLKEDCANLCNTLRSMVAEETAELFQMGDIDEVTEINEILLASAGPRGIDALLKILNEAHEAADKAGRDVLVKAMAAVGAANTAVLAKAKSKKEMGHIQAAHDHLAAAHGGCCDGGDASKAFSAKDKSTLEKCHDMMKSVGADCGMNKMLDAGTPEALDMVKVVAERDALKKQISTVEGRLATVLDRVSKLEAAPVEPKGVRRSVAIAKSADGGDGTVTPTSGDPIDQISDILGKMSDEERASALMKAAMRNGKVLAA